jgi:hypothetical protein
MIGIRRHFIRDLRNNQQLAVVNVRQLYFSASSVTVLSAGRSHHSTVLDNERTQNQAPGYPWTPSDGDPDGVISTLSRVSLF